MSSMIEIANHLFQLASRVEDAHHPVSSYLWRNANGTVLIDPHAGVTPDDTGAVDDILITHLQEENAAGCLNFPSARIHVPCGDEYLCRGMDAYTAVIGKWNAPWSWDDRGRAEGNIGGARIERPLLRSIPLAGTLVPGGKVCGFDILSTPGHGKNAVTLVADIDGRRVGFSGDLVCDDGKLWNWFDSEWDYECQTGQNTLLESARRLVRHPLDLLCPTHGPLCQDPAAALTTLAGRLQGVLHPPPVPAAQVEVVTGEDSVVPGFRRLLPHLHQLTANYGNCAILVSETGNALLIDDGLCQWIPLSERASHHRALIDAIKRKLGIRHIEMVIPTHYHGDHIENIPELVALEGSRVVCLDIVADVIEHPERYNLICPLPWYDTGHDRIAIDQRVPDGTCVRWHEYNLEISHLGGQTYYHAGITTDIDGQRVMFLGDATHPGGKLESVICYNDAEPAQRGWLYALRRIAERDPDLLVYGHGQACGKVTQAVATKIEAWEAQLERFRALSVRSEPRLFFNPFV